MKKIIRPIIFSIVGLIASVSILHGADTGYPTGATLLDYGIKKNNPPVNLTTTAGLRAALAAYVSEFISQPRWAPFHEWFGIKYSSASMTEPADVFLALSLAYPHLSANLQQQVRTYLRSQWTASQPYQNLDYPDIKGGTPRNWHRVDPDDYDAAFGSPFYGHPVSNRLIQLYPLFLFAQNCDSWDLLSAQYTRIRTVYENVPSLASRDDGNNCRNIASVIAFIRIADKLGYSTDVTSALAKLQSMVQAKIDHQRSEGSECVGLMNTGLGDQSNSGGCLYYKREYHVEIITQFYGMVPELGKILRDYATTASNNIEQWINRNAQGFWLVNGDTPVQEGENFKPWYITTMSYFHIMSDIQAVDFDSHRQLVDMPACRADVYYVQRLVRAIEASGPQNWVHYSVPYSGSPGTGVPGPPLNLKLLGQ